MSLVQNLRSLSNLVGKLKLVDRSIYAEHTDRRETTAEHTCQLAILAWYAAKYFGLNESKAIKYALVHDLVEVTAFLDIYNEFRDVFGDLVVQFIITNIQTNTM